MAKDIITKINEQISELIETKERQIGEVREKLNQANKDLEIAEEALKAATANTDLSAFTNAKTAKTAAVNAIEMLTGRLDQLQSNEYVTEQESDAVIKSILDYENSIAVQFRKEISQPLDQLDSILKTYLSNVQRAENTITTWCDEIHSNYRDESGQRQDKPRPVHRIPYHGCGDAFALVGALQKFGRGRN